MTESRISVAAWTIAVVVALAGCSSQGAPAASPNARLCYADRRLRDHERASYGRPLIGRSRTQLKEGSVRGEGDLGAVASAARGSLRSGAATLQRLQVALDALILKEWGTHGQALHEKAMGSGAFFAEAFAARDGIVASGKKVTYEDYRDLLRDVRGRLALACESVRNLPLTTTPAPASGVLLETDLPSRGVLGRRLDGTPAPSLVLPTGLASVATSRDHRRFAAIADAGAGTEIDVIDGSIVRKLATLPDRQFCPSIASDGDVMTVRAKRNGSSALVVTDPTGHSHDVALPVPAVEITCAAFLDDRHVAFERGEPDVKRPRIWAAALDGTELRELPTPAGCSATFPSASPHGVSFITSCVDVANNGLYEVTASTTAPTHLVTGLIGVYDYTPDGMWMAFANFRYAGDPHRPDLYVAHSDGSELHLVRKAASFPIWLAFP